MGFNPIGNGCVDNNSTQSMSGVRRKYVPRRVFIVKCGTEELVYRYLANAMKNLDLGNYEKRRVYYDIKKRGYHSHRYERFGLVIITKSQFMDWLPRWGDKDYEASLPD